MTTAPATTTATSPSTTPSPASTATQLTGIPDYWIGESQRSFRPYREFRTVTHVAGGTVASAVSAMMRLKPLDPDYTSPWRPPSQLRVTQSGRAITVDLSTDAFANTQVGGELAERAVQQLVYTATAAAHTAGHDATTVAVTVKGAQYDAWGVIGVGSPMRRPAMLDVQALARVTSPQEGEVRRAGMLAFTGYGASFEAIFAWKFTSSSGAVVARGSAIGGRGPGLRRLHVLGPVGQGLLHGSGDDRRPVGWRLRCGARHRRQAVHRHVGLSEHDGRSPRGTNKEETVASHKTQRGRKSWAEMSPRQRGFVVIGAVAQLGLQAAALRDLRRRPADEVRGPKWAWAAATFVNTLGPVTYFLIGRRRGGGAS